RLAVRCSTSRIGRGARRMNSAPRSSARTSTCARLQKCGPARAIAPTPRSAFAAARGARPMQNLAIDRERLWDELMETAAIGGTPKGGICRLTLTDLDRQVRDWFRARCEALGCTVTVDDMGVMYARRAGQRDDIPPIAMGSHLDTQPTGGKFDGTLGVFAALEALAALHRAGYETFAPIEVINWTNEEGSRFTPGMIASAVFAGAYTRDWAHARQDRQ